jgi:hypothetical protein
MSAVGSPEISMLTDVFVFHWATITRGIMNSNPNKMNKAIPGPDTGMPVAF